MPKPIVVLIPEKERKKLREAGILPPETFRTFRASSRQNGGDGPDGSILLWPHSLDYARGVELAEGLSERPADIPAFFGIPTGATEEQRQADEREVAALLGSTVVHVVFLDTRKAKGGYAEFGSFGALADWCRSFRKALNVRFPHESALRQADNVLVVVVRGQQVQTTPGELSAFRECIGAGAPFVSCYFLDYNLHVGGTEELFHSTVVWDAMLSRLLLAFLLSRGDTHATPVWRRPGIKVWRAGECVVRTDAPLRRRTVDGVLTHALVLLHGNVDGMVDAADAFRLFDDRSGEAPPALDLQPLVPDAERTDLPDPDPDLDRPQRHVGVDGWAEFNSAELVDWTGRPGRWTQGLEDARSGFREWVLKHPPADPGTDSVVFRKIHEEPSALFRFVERLAALVRGRGPSGERGASTGADELHSLWMAVASKDAERRATLARLEAESREFEAGRRHYVGRGFGMVIVGAVSLACGWVLHRIVSAFVAGTGVAPAIGSLWLSLVLAGSVFAGSLAAFFLVVGLHGLAGRRAAERVLETSRAADRAMIERDERARRMVAGAMDMRSALRLRGLRFRVLSLLRRVDAILETELQPESVLVNDQEPDEDGAAGADPAAAAAANPREAFLRKTRSVVGPLGAEFGPEAELELDAVVRAWWGGGAEEVPPEAEPEEDFLTLWRRLCREDAENAGHFPARTFVSGIRRFTRRFTEVVRRLVEDRAVEANVDHVRDGVRTWAGTIAAERYDHLASATVPPDALVWRRQPPPILFVRDDPSVADMAQIEDELQTVQSRLTTQLQPSALLRIFPQLGLLFQEYEIGLDVEPETSVLKFTEAGHG